MAAFVGVGEAAKLIGVSPGVLRWHLLYGRVGDIEQRAPNGARLFTPGDIQRIKAVLNPGRERQRSDA